MSETTTTEAPTKRKRKKRTKSRGNGEGTIYAEGGRWVAALSYFDGQRFRRKKHRCDTQEEAQAFLDELRRQRRKRTIDRDDRLTLAAFLRDWLEGKKGEIEESTWIGYEEVVRLYLIPELGHVALGTLDAATLRTFQRMLAAKKKTPSRIAAIRRVLRSALSQAESDGLVDSNAAKKVEPPKGSGAATVSKRVYDSDEVARILAAAKDHRLGAMVVAALGTGLRRGELLGWKWTDIDLDGRIARIERQVQRRRHERDEDKRVVRRHGIGVKPPKSAKSIREVPLPAFVVDALREHEKTQKAERLKAGPLWVDTGHVFTTKHGALIDPRNALRSFYEIVDEAKVPRKTMHGTRHTTASQLAALNVPRTVTRDLMGHTDSRTTDRYYTHTAREQLRGAADALDRARS